MDKQSRRQAVRDYKERKVRAGIYAVRLGAETWVGLSRNLDGQENSLAFGLKTGSFRNPAMQAAWKAQGEGEIAFEVLEVVDDEDMTALGREELLKRRQRHWLDQLGAKKAVG